MNYLRFCFLIAFLRGFFDAPFFNIRLLMRTSVCDTSIGRL